MFSIRRGRSVVAPSLAFPNCSSSVSSVSSSSVKESSRATTREPNTVATRGRLPSRLPAWDSSERAMNLRALGIMAVFAFTTLAASLDAKAQPPGKVPRIGVFGPESRTTYDSLEMFRQGLRDFGYVEGRNIVIERAKTSADPSRRAAEL